MTAKKQRANENDQPSQTDSEAARAEANAKAAAEEAARMAEEAASAEGAAEEADSLDFGDAGGEATAEANLQAEIEDLRERLQRAMAETENVRRRADRERQETQKYAATGFAKDLLGVADNLRRAIDAVSHEEAESNQTLRTLLEGVQMTERELHEAFEKHHIKPIQAVPGQKFDPHYHEAMFEVPTDEQNPGTIVHILQTGYMLHERLLRPTRVGVAKAGDGNGAGGNGQSVDQSA